MTDAGSSIDGHKPPRGMRLSHPLPEPRPEFRDLYERMMREQWTLDHIDWTQKPKVESIPFLKKDLLEIRACFVADCLIGEAYTLVAAGQRLDQLESADEKLCFGLMIADEHRHMEALRRYQKLLGVVREPDIRLQKHFDEESGIDIEQLCIDSFVGETLFCLALPMVWRTTRDPLLREILPRIHRDELRHVEFVKLYLRSRLPQWSAARRDVLRASARACFLRSTELLLKPRESLRESLSPPMYALTVMSGRRLISRACRIYDQFFSEVGLTFSVTLPGEERAESQDNHAIPAIESR